MGSDSGGRLHGGGDIHLFLRLNSNPKADRLVFQERGLLNLQA